MTDSTTKDMETAAEMQVAATLAAAIVQQRGMSSMRSKDDASDVVETYKKVLAELRKPQGAHAASADDGKQRSSGA